MSSRSSRTPSRSQSSSAYSSRSHSVSPSSKRFNSRIPNLLYVYCGIALFFLIAILSHSISPPQMYETLPRCASFRKEVVTNFPLFENISAIINKKENITKSELLDELNLIWHEVIDLNEVDSAIRSNHYFEESDGSLHNCLVPINTGGFLFFAILLFVTFAVLAALSYLNQN